MIQAKFFYQKGRIFSFEISGHAGYADYGQDIVCAAVTSAALTVINGITECARLDASVDVSDGKIAFTLLESNETGLTMLDALKLQLDFISESYENTIEVTDTEV